jgi:hypothetical protein
MTKTKVLSSLLMGVAILSVLLKLSGVVDWSWFVALLPLMVWVAIPIVALVIYVILPE